MNEIESLYEDKQEVSIDKILCILEGQDELNFIKKIYELDKNKKISCQEFTRDKIELSWGKEPIFWNDFDKCKFQGGDITGFRVPKPVLESLKFNDPEDYKAILIMFDKDRDINDKVENSAKEILANLNNYIFTSNPCFEKVGIDFILTDEIRHYIDDNYHIIDDSKCRWYKKNFANLPKSTLAPQKKRFKRVQSLEGLINYLKIEDIKDENIELKDCISFIKSNFESES